MRNKLKTPNSKLQYWKLEIGNWKFSPAFTLIELLIYMGILSIFLVVLTDIFTSILSVKTESEATSQVEQDGRFIIGRLAYDATRASSISTPSTYGTPGTNSLSLIISGITYAYSLSGSNLTLTNDLGTNNLNGSGTQVSGLNFQKIGNSGGKDTIKLLMTITSTTTRPGGPEIKNFQTTVGRR